MIPMTLQYFLFDIEKQKDKECEYIRKLMYTLISDTTTKVKIYPANTSCDVEPSKLHFLKRMSFKSCNGHADFVQKMKDIGLELNIYKISTLEKGRIHYDVLNKNINFFQKRNY